jgi:hypothetical protein
MQKVRSSIDPGKRETPAGNHDRRLRQRRRAPSGEVSTSPPEREPSFAPSPAAKYEQFEQPVQDDVKAAGLDERYGHAVAEVGIAPLVAP